MDLDDRQFQFPGSSGTAPHHLMPRYSSDASVSYDQQPSYTQVPSQFDPRYLDQRHLLNQPQPLTASTTPPSPDTSNAPLSKLGHNDRPSSGLPPARPTVQAPIDYNNVSPVNESPLDNALSSAAEYSAGTLQPSHQHSNGEPPPYPNASTNYHPHLIKFSEYYNSHSAVRSQRKTNRAQQACDQCRARKAKCDEGRPNCSHCKENNLVCAYKDNPPHKQEKFTQLVMDRITQLENALDRQQNTFKRIENTVDRTINRLDLMNVKLNMTHDMMRDRADDIVKIQTEHGLRMESLVLSGRSSKLTKGEAARPAQRQAEDTPLKQEDGPAAAATSSSSLSAIQDESEAALVNEDPYWLHTIPVEHSTAAHKLLAWRWIKHILPPNSYDEDYVMRLEEARGLIRVYGRGEGNDGSEDVGQPYADASSMNSSHGKTPGIESGILTTPAETVRRYHRRYLENMHRLHPFLHQIDLEDMIELFIKAYCQKPTVPVAMMGSGDGTSLPRGVKRKHSDRSPTQRVERTINNAIVLLVLAIGSICDRRDKPLPWLDSAARGPDQSPSSTRSFSPSSSQTCLSSKPAIRNGPELMRLRNLDVIPGMAYYAYATDILGNLQGGVCLSHAQAALLAGIYAGQLAHPFQSHGWIFQAARACQVLLRPKRYMQLDDGPEKDLYLFNFWTCFQLESDLLAELDLPASGIAQMESRLPLPTGQYTLKALNIPGENDPNNFTMMLLYSAQVHLRKILNRIHTDLYTVAKRNSEREDLYEILGLTLTQWRVTLPTHLQWNDDDPPAEDINIARLRAKYYGARYIIYRPVLYHCLEAFPPSSNLDLTNDNPDPPAGKSNLSGDKSDPLEVQPKANGHRKKNSLLPGNESAFTRLPPDAQRACRTCITSAIQSTKAFDGVKGGRPVVTNIFGTAHAQFGNMLVLSATHVSPLGELVNRDELDRLLLRTICFLEVNQKISPTLRKDAEILRATYMKIFNTEPIVPR